MHTISYSIPFTVSVLPEDLPQPQLPRVPLSGKIKREGSRVQQTYCVLVLAIAMNRWRHRVLGSIRRRRRELGEEKVPAGSLPPSLFGWAHN